MAMMQQVLAAEAGRRQASLEAGPLPTSAAADDALTLSAAAR